jgi:oxygen-independent coproporphyrinogen-3 oxidase
LAGIYIHIPFCKQACNYCNFYFSTSLKQKDNVLKALNKEILISPLITKGPEQIETIYIGGGTPSLITSDELAGIFETLHKKFEIKENAEITLEANPDDINRIILKKWQLAGVNRLSLGIQSFVQSELVWMNRAHNADESLNSINEIQEAGFTNFSVDLIYGSPLLSNDALKETLDIIFKKQIPHISCYALTVESKTALHKMIETKKSQAVDPEKQAEQFLLLMNLMKQNNFEQYEISNFAQTGMRSLHNSSYWQGKAYYGFGPAAHSFDGKNCRRWNISNNSLYIQSLLKDIIPYEEEILTKTQQLNEYIMTSLRTMEGLDLELVSLKFGNDISEDLKARSRKYIESNKLITEGEKLILNQGGKLFADGIAADLFF